MKNILITSSNNGCLELEILLGYGQVLLVLLLG
jgi:hypothetical protein